MANKRIELEGYKHYVDLLEEEPNRKRMRTGLKICMVVAFLLIIFLMVAGFMSANLAQNPRNVLELPPEKPQSTAPGAGGTQFPGGTQIPGGTEIPGGVEIPGGTQIPGTEIPGGTQIPGGQPLEIPQGRLPSTLASDATASLEVPEGALLAQAEPEVTLPGVSDSAPSIDTDISSPQPGSSVPGPTGPGQETKGVGNLANLANKLNGRGFQLYVLLFTIFLAVIVYLALRQGRKQGKSS